MSSCVYVRVVTLVDEDEETLIDAVSWLLRRKFLSRKKDASAWVTIDDSDGSYMESIYKHTWKDVSTIQGKIEFSYELEKKLGIPKEGLTFEAKLEAIPTPKHRYEYDGVVVKLGEPINKQYWIKGLDRREFQIVKVEG